MTDSSMAATPIANALDAPDIVFWARAVQFAQGAVGEGPFCEIAAEEWEIAHVAIAQVAPDVFVFQAVIPNNFPSSRTLIDHLVGRHALLRPTQDVDHEWKVSVTVFAEEDVCEDEYKRFVEMLTYALTVATQHHDTMEAQILRLQENFFDYTKPSQVPPVREDALVGVYELVTDFAAKDVKISMDMVQRGLDDVQTLLDYIDNQRKGCVVCLESHASEPSLRLVLIPTCGHVVCRSCIEKVIDVGNEKCPTGCNPERKIASWIALELSLKVTGYDDDHLHAVEKRRSELDALQSDINRTHQGLRVSVEDLKSKLASQQG
ncbi:hypothetical protein C8Q76DRAFT_689215 [Earliella scabrosa]|nr:hypothetical protein C8Q76DRAFT_689215 [Earliella scabrosa]